MSDYKGIYDTSKGKCAQVLMVEGEAFPCILATNHDGWAHQNDRAEAIWESGRSAELDKALAAIQRVRGLHEPGGYDLLECMECSNGKGVEYPCPTILALNGN